MTAGNGRSWAATVVTEVARIAAPTPPQGGKSNELLRPPIRLRVVGRWASSPVAPRRLHPEGVQGEGVSGVGGVLDGRPALRGRPESQVWPGTGEQQLPTGAEGSHGVQQRSIVVVCAVESAGPAVFVSGHGS